MSKTCLRPYICGLVFELAAAEINALMFGSQQAAVLPEGSQLAGAPLRGEPALVEHDNDGVRQQHAHEVIPAIRRMKCILAFSPNVWVSDR